MPFEKSASKIDSNRIVFDSIQKYSNEKQFEIASNTNRFVLKRIDLDRKRIDLK